jgi:hypothetical protein
MEVVVVEWLAAAVELHCSDKISARAFPLR